MERESIEFLFNFGYTILFGILGIACFVMNMPKQKTGVEGYMKARKTLGTSMFLMAAYTLFRIVVPHPHHAMYFEHLWSLTTFTLIFSWLTYASALFFIGSPRYLRRNFIIDGIIPTFVMVAAGFVGLLVPATQQVVEILFGVIFGVKCVRMYYICEKEYRICLKDVENSADERPEITWIDKGFHGLLILSILTVGSFYIRALDLVYYILIPVIYTFIVIKVVNFLPAALARVREIDPKENNVESNDKVRDLIDKIAPKVEVWINQKGFCTPEMTIKDVAMQMGTNHNYLSTYLNKHLKMTFQTWLNTLRIEESKILLTSEKIPIEEVGIRVGIPQSYNFSRWFRVITGTTPYQYRKENS